MKLGWVGFGLPHCKFHFSVRLTGSHIVYGLWEVLSQLNSFIYTLWEMFTYILIFSFTSIFLIQPGIGKTVEADGQECL